MTPEQMLDKAEDVLKRDRAYRPFPRAALAAAWTLLAVATKFVRPQEVDHV